MSTVIDRRWPTIGHVNARFLNQVSHQAPIAVVTRKQFVDRIRTCRIADSACAVVRQGPEEPRDEAPRNGNGPRNEPWHEDCTAHRKIC